MKFRAGQYVDALEEYEKALAALETASTAQHPDTHVALLNNRAACMLKLGNARACSEDCDAALAIDPSNLKALLRRAVANEQRERYLDAQRDYQTVCRAAPGTAQANQGLARVSKMLRVLEGDDLVRRRPAGNAAAEEGNTKNGRAAAAAATKEAVGKAAAKTAAPSASSPSVSSPSVSVSSATATTTTTASTPAPTPGARGSQDAYEKEKEGGNAHFKAGRLQQAVEAYGRCIALNPAATAAFNNRSLVWLRLGEAGRAEADATVVLHREPTNVKAWFRRGQARRAQDDLEGALSDFERVIVLDANNAAAAKECASLQAVLKARTAKSKPVTAAASAKPGRRLTVEEVDDDDSDNETQTETKTVHAKPDPATKAPRQLVQEIASEEAVLDGEAEVRLCHDEQGKNGMVVLRETTKGRSREQQKESSQRRSRGTVEKMETETSKGSKISRASYLWCHSRLSAQ